MCALNIDDNGPLLLGAGGLDIGVANLQGLGYDVSGNLRVVLDTDKGLEFGAGGGLGIKLDTDPGLLLGAGGPKADGRMRLAECSSTKNGQSYGWHSTVEVKIDKEGHATDAYLGG